MKHETRGSQSSEFSLTKTVVLFAMLLTAVGGVLTGVTSGGAQIAGAVMTAVGGAVMAWATGAYAKSRGIVKRDQGE